MKTRPNTLLFVILMILACSVSAETPKIVIEHNAAEDVHILSSRISHEGNFAFVEGRLKRLRHTAIVDSGFVEVTVINAAGDTLMQTRVPFRPWLGRRNSHQARFQARLPETLPANSTVHIAFRRS